MQDFPKLVEPLPITFQEMADAAPVVRSRLYNVTKAAVADIAALKTNETRRDYWQIVASWALKNHDEVEGCIEGFEAAAMKKEMSVNAGTS